MRVDVQPLSRDDSLALVQRHHMGRIGIGLHDLIRVELTPYAYADDWIYVRAKIDEDFEVISPHPWAAFEVDEVDSIYDWRSVEVTGAIEILSSDPNAQHRFEYEQAVRILRGAVPALLTADDPRPEHVHVLRIHVDTVLGRSSRSVDGVAPPVPS